LGLADQNADDRDQDADDQNQALRRHESTEAGCPRTPSRTLVALLELAEGVEVCGDFVKLIVVEQMGVDPLGHGYRGMPKESRDLIRATPSARRRLAQVWRRP